MISALVIAKDMIDHDALLSCIDESRSGLLPVIGCWEGRGITETGSLGLVVAQPGLRCRVDVCGPHWCADVGLRQDRDRTVW